MAKFPILCAWTQRKVKGLPLNYSDISISYIENITKMFFKKPNQEYKNNKMIFFPSYAGHRVDEVQMFKTGERNGRYSLTHFYYIPLDKNQMPISTQ